MGYVGEALDGAACRRPLIVSPLRRLEMSIREALGRGVN